MAGPLVIGLLSQTFGLLTGFVLCSVLRLAAHLWTAQANTPEGWCILALTGRSKWKFVRRDKPA
jgi:hypothetical protein